MVCPSYTNAFVMDGKGDIVTKFSGGDDHFGNFVKAVRSRKVEDLTADILEVICRALCHLGNISYRCGTLEAFGQEDQGVWGRQECGGIALSGWRNTSDHMLPLDGTKVQVGKKLVFDPKNERFADDKDANTMLTREYRKGFEVPAKL